MGSIPVGDVSKGAKLIFLKYATKADAAGGNVVSQAGARSLEIVDADTMRDAEGGAVLHRATKTVEMRLKPAADITTSSLSELSLLSENNVPAKKAIGRMMTSRLGMIRSVR